VIVYTPDAAIKFTGRDDSPSDHLVIKETWVENVYRINESDFCDSKVMLDIGANIGAVSVYAASLGAHVVAVEPDPDNLAYLRRNLADNDFPGSYEVIEAAVTDKPGTLNLQPGHGHSQIVARKSKSTVEVAGITLADVYRAADAPYCDVLKVDIEGAEYPLIAATPIDVLRKARYISLEFDAAPLKKFGELVAKLACEFHIEILGSPERGGYIYARRYD
jgi:FkbM family methyltransferase